MKKILILSLVLGAWLTSKSQAPIHQSDTITVFIEDKKTDADGKTHVWYSKVEDGKILNGRKDTLFYSVCPCDPSHIPNKGDTSHILRNQLVYVPGKLTWRKVNN